MSISVTSKLKPRILFVSHLANYSGASLLFNSILENVDPLKEWDKIVLLRRGGDTVDEIIRSAPAYIIDNGGVLALSEPIPGCQSKYDDLNAFFGDVMPDLVYSNTVTNTEVVACASNLGIPVVVHVHETKPAFQKYCGPYPQVTLNASHLICVSKSVMDYLVQDYNVPNERVSLVFGGIDTKHIDSMLDRPSLEVKQDLGVPSDALVIGGAGDMVLHKGVDIWLQMARRVYLSVAHLNPYFIWVGNDKKEYGQEMKRNIPMMGLEGRVIFTGEKQNPFPILNIMDIFVMSSRYEALGLVNIEAAYLGKPVVCFRCSGGPKEIVEDDAGIVVELLDAFDLAEGVVQLANDADRRKVIGARARRKVFEKFQINDKIAAVRDILRKTLKHI